MKTILPLAAALATAFLVSSAPRAAVADHPFYDHSMQALGSSELGMPPARPDAGRGAACLPLVDDANQNCR